MFDCCTSHYEIMPATLANTLLFILQGSALADLMCGGILRVHYTWSQLISILTVKELLKSYSICQSYAQMKTIQFLPRDAMHKRGLCRHAVHVCLSVSLSVCLSRSWFMSKRIKVSSKFFHHRVATPF